MFIFLFALFLAYVLFMAIWGYFDIKKISDKIISENEKVKNYREGIIIGWIPVLVLITFIICVGFLAFLLYQIISYLVSEKYRKKIEEEIKKPKNRFMYNIVLPHTFKEKKYFFGIC